MGDQSSGKSSVLEALAGVPFPRGSGLVTRCPIRLSMKRSAPGTRWSAVAHVTNEASKFHSASSPDQLTKVCTGVGHREGAFMFVVGRKGANSTEDSMLFFYVSFSAGKLEWGGWGRGGRAAGCDLPGLTRVCVVGWRVWWKGMVEPRVPCACQ